MRLKTLAVMLYLLSVITPQAHAHDFWLAPDTYTVKPNKEIALSVMIGHPADRMEWPVAPHRIVAFRSIGPNGVQDHQSSIMDAKQSGDIQLEFKDRGLHILTIETTHALSTLDAKKFHDYLEEEGLTPIKVDRVLKGTTENPGTEVYSRRGKALIQVGKRGKADPAYLSKPVGLTLEIVPDKNPARVKAGELMKSTIYYRGKPVKGATIGLIDLKGDQGLVDIERSGSTGRVGFTRPEQGQWMLHAVWAAPLEGDSRANYDTVFSSLSFSLE